MHQFTWFILHECINSLYSPCSAQQFTDSPSECIRLYLILSTWVHHLMPFLWAHQFTWFFMRKFTWFFPQECISSFYLYDMSASVHLNPSSVIHLCTKWMTALCFMGRAHPTQLFCGSICPSQPCVPRTLFLFFSPFPNALCQSITCTF